MSYRAFKRLLGETSLERKCRFLFGGFILLLITGSFWLYARQTEHLAYDQLKTTCRVLVVQVVADHCRPERPSPEQKQRAEAMSEFRKGWEKDLTDQNKWSKAMQLYQSWLIKADPSADRVPDQMSLAKVAEFQGDPELHEDSHL